VVQSFENCAGKNGEGMTAGETEASIDCSLRGEFVDLEALKVSC
jgi:hypothetical protein